MKNAVNWFEIPANNFQRAKTFYEAVLQTEMATREMEEMGSVMALFPYEEPESGVGGSIISGPGYKPSQQGAMIYLNGGEDLSLPLSRVEKAGGKVVLPKTSLGPNGFMAQFIDTEGNRVAFHSMQ